LSDELACNEGEEEEGKLPQKFIQWSSSDNKVFLPSQRTTKKLSPGIYEIHQNQSIGTYFQKIEADLSGLVSFAGSNADKVVSEIQKFWTREQKFRKVKLPFKRGILLYGPPGSGKTCTIKLVIRNLIQDHSGVVIKFTQPALFTSAMRTFREVQRHTPVIVLMEDMDNILENYYESEVINILDGVDTFDKVVYLATTNYPEKLSDRILNRPSRFDRRFYIGTPNEQERRVYIQTISEGVSKIQVPKWVKDTEGFTIAHIKELFISVEVMGDDYDKSLAYLKEMKKKITSESDGQKVGLDA